MKNKKITKIVLSCILAINITSVVDAVGLYEAGIYKQTNNNSKTYQYEEVTFVTGKPVVLKGTLTRTKIEKSKEDELLQKAIDKSKKKVKKKDKNKDMGSNTISDVTVEEPLTYNGTKISEKYILSGSGITLSRELTISPKNEYHKGQIVQKNEITKIKETINTGGKKYILNGNLSEMSESIVIDKKPVIDYHAGNSNFYKVFDSEDSTMIIQLDGKSFGYDEFWGATSTKVMNYTINTTPKEGKKEVKKTDNSNDTQKSGSENINGTYTVKNSQNTIKDLIYSENDPKKISFNGGYIVTSQNNGALEYTYDINGNTGSGHFENENLPSITRLFAPVLTDMQGHYAQESAQIITSMNGFEPSKKMFLPNAPISRDEFARAVVVTAGLYNNKTDTKKNNYILKEELFSDVKIRDINYNYVKKAVDSKLMIGRDDNKFEPKNPITRAEAIKILTDSLGLDSLIPNGKFNTVYEDQSDIPHWAFDNVYIAQHIGLVEKGGVFSPNEELTKADASELLVRYIEYMTGDLKQDYMTNIINY